MTDHAPASEPTDATDAQEMLDSLGVIVIGLPNAPRDAVVVDYPEYDVPVVLVDKALELKPRRLLDSVMDALLLTA